MWQISWGIFTPYKPDSHTETVWYITSGGCCSNGDVWACVCVCLPIRDGKQSKIVAYLPIKFGSKFFFKKLYIFLILLKPFSAK